MFCRDLGRAIFGERWGVWAIAPFQWSVLIGLAITYTATAGQSLQVGNILAVCLEHPRAVSLCALTLITGTTGAGVMPEQYAHSLVCCSCTSHQAGIHSYMWVVRCNTCSNAGYEAVGTARSDRKLRSLTVPQWP